MLNLLFSVGLLSFLCSWSTSLFVMFFYTLVYLMFSYESFLFKSNSFYELDLVSVSLILLSFWVVVLSLMASQYIKFNELNKKKFIFCLILLIAFLVTTFSFSSFIMFYIGFECSVLPVLGLVLGWGYQPERVGAGLYLLFYTMVASLPLLILIVSMEGMSMNFFVEGFYGGQLSGVLCMFLIGAFLVKYPMYSVHLWLPKAHVEAPVSGSMILAGVLLKLGGYGMIRFLPLIKLSPSSGFLLLISLSLMGGFYMSLVCLAQMDMKSLIACSSVVHMSGCIGSLLCFNESCKNGCILMMLAHGLCSSGLFYLTGLVYNLTGSRSFYINKGLLNILPSLSLWWFLLIACNMACPPTLNLLSEIKMTIGLVNFSWLCAIPVGLMVFFSCAYGVFLFSLSQHGKFLSSKQMFKSNDLLSYLTLVLHWLPLNLLILSVFFLV
uniref:NADH dehydrogenase subunit 4 n=1 Tax=Caprella penantis TaxID=1282972 RepID=UPI0023D87EE4|nr:NADH dehydrogenase subunit 4 [Caprella penantis]WCR50884.1 NADH dehydrogenase subunit 4 [Caprella penantis]